MTSSAILMASIAVEGLRDINIMCAYRYKLQSFICILYGLSLTGREYVAGRGKEVSITAL